MKITFLIDNKTESTECNAEWGLSLLVEANGQKILMDQGGIVHAGEKCRRPWAGPQ